MTSRPPRPRLLRAVIALATAWLLLLAPGSLASADSATPTDAAAWGERTFYNPVRVGADPSVVLHDGAYYSVSSQDGGILVRRAPRLSALGEGESAMVWTNPPDGPLCCEVWAPEIQRIDGSWYIYVATDDGRNENHRMRVMRALTDDPLGPWSAPQTLTDPSDRWAIDGTAMELPDGRLYFLWSGWEGDVNVRQNLYIAPMSDPMTISGERTMLSTPTEPWETVDDPDINEGPEVLQRNGRIFVVYSASGSWTDDYCLGMLTHASGDLTDPTTWTKSDGCVFSKRPTAYGPGHHTFTTSPDGTEDWIVYHANTVSGTSWGGRTVRAQPFGWDADGTPDFGSPVAVTTPIPVPSGEQGPLWTTYEAEGGVVHGAARVVVPPVPGATGGAKVGYLDDAQSWVEIPGVQAPADGVYDLRIRYGNGTGATASHLLSVDGEAQQVVTYPSNGWDNWAPTTVRVRLHEGANTIRLTHAQGYAEVDHVRLGVPEGVYAVSGGPAVADVSSRRPVTWVWRAQDGASPARVDAAAVRSWVTACGSAERVAGDVRVRPLADGRVQVRWRAAEADAGTCRTLHVELGDGLERVVDLDVRP